MQKLDTQMLQERLKSIRVGGLEKEITAVTKYLKDAPDLKIATINPRRVAKKQGLESNPTLKAFLHMTKAGIFDMHWSVHCPHCRGSIVEYDSLEQVSQHQDCPSCKDDFNSNFDQNLELKFKLNSAIGTLENLDSWAILEETIDLEPGISIELEAGETKTIQRVLKAGNYAIFSKDEKIGINIPVAESRGQLDHKIDLEEFQSPLILPAKVGDNSFSISAPKNRPVQMLFSRMGEADWIDASTATTLQEFRDFFSKELLSSNEQFSIKNLTFVFTDIKGSTEMYERLGDSEAFSVVKEHFKILENVVRDNEGAIVKTIGDAIMAVFTSPAKAIHATRDMIDSFDRYNLKKTERDEIIIKIGVHSGPCIAVTLNEKLDYFGTTVNLAARVQGLSDGRDIMISENAFLQGRVEESFSKEFWESEVFTTSLKGIAQAQKVYKLHRLK